MIERVPYLGSCERCDRTVSVVVPRTDEHHSGDPTAWMRCRRCGDVVLGLRDGVEERNRPWGDGPEWLIDRDRPDVHHFPDWSGGESDD